MKCQNWKIGNLESEFKSGSEIISIWKSFLILSLELELIALVLIILDNTIYMKVMTLHYKVKMKIWTENIKNKVMATSMLNDLTADIKVMKVSFALLGSRTNKNESISVR